MKSLTAIAAVSTLFDVAQDEATPPARPPAGSDLGIAPDIDGIQAREDRDAGRIQHADDVGDPSPGEAHRVREELANIRTQEAELARRNGPGLNATDRQFINDRLDQLGHTIRHARGIGLDLVTHGTNDIRLRRV